MTAADDEAIWRFDWNDHPSWRYGDNTRIDLRGRVQADYRRSDLPVGEPDAIDVARKRIGIDGRIEGLLEFQVEAELKRDEPWRDVYIDYTQFTTARLQAGQFKLPFSLDENTSSTNRDFVYRSLAAGQLAPGRDRGAMVHGRIASGLVRYELGLFDHDGRNARTNNPDRAVGGRTTAGRLAVQPFRNRRSPFRDLHAAAAFTAGGVPPGLSGLRGRTALDSSFFEGDLWVRGQRRRSGVEARWRPGPFSLAAEYIRVTTERLGQSVHDTDLSPLVATGWYVSGTWVVTGQGKAGNLDRPRASILRGGAGAVELAVRLESLGYRSAASDGPPSTSRRADVILGNRDRATTVGINWYPLHGVKLQANLIHEQLSTRELAPSPAGSDLWSGVFRLQLTL
jgi:phosphate-selective porin OprO/OprP